MCEKFVSVYFMMLNDPEVNIFDRGQSDGIKKIKLHISCGEEVDKVVTIYCDP